MAVLDAINYPPQFSTDSGTTWKDLICIKDWTLSDSVSVQEEETFCAVYSAVGRMKSAGSANAICDTAPTSTQLSYEDVKTLMAAGTAALFRIQSPTSGTPGTNFYESYSCYFTQCDLNFPYGNKVAFSVNWVNDGVIDITP